tara:strand:- start:1568 stop:1714 length:147 start_codon:yes stop_codon:yes gene_type:complete
VTKIKPLIGAAASAIGGYLDFWFGWQVSAWVISAFEPGGLIVLLFVLA